MPPCGSRSRRAVFSDRTPHLRRRGDSHVNNRVNVLLDEAGFVVLADVG